MNNAFLGNDDQDFQAQLNAALAASEQDVARLRPSPEPATVETVVSPPDSAPVASGSAMAPAKMRTLYEAAARAYNVPANVLMAMGATESMHNPGIVGPETRWGRAKGIMQYLDSTASSLGFNPLDAKESIDHAAQQLRERLDKNYSMRDAVMEHHGGPDRSLWKQKTDAYGRKVLRRAAELFDQYQQEDTARSQTREADREAAAANKRDEYYGNPATRGIANPASSMATQSPPATPEQASALLGPDLAAGLRQDRQQMAGLMPDMAADAVLKRAEDRRQHDLEQRQKNLAASRQSLVAQGVSDLARGTRNLDGIASGLVAAGAQAIGQDAVADAALRDYQDGARRNDIDNPAVIGTYKNIHDLGDFGRYAIEAVMENLPMFLPSLGGGAAGAMGARAGAQKLVAKEIERQMAKGASRAAAEQAALRMVQRRVMAGTAAGAAPASVAMETGSIMGDIYDKTGQKRPGLALAYGLPAGLLDTLEPVMALRKLAGPVVDEVAGHIIKRLGVEAGKQFLTEAGTEGLQTIVENAAVSHADGRKLFTPELADDVIDSMLKGGIGGGVIGAGSEATHAYLHDGAAKPTPIAPYAAAVEATFKGSGPLSRVANRVAPQAAAAANPQQSAAMDRPPVGMDPYLPEEAGAPAAQADAGQAGTSPAEPTLADFPAGEMAELETPAGVQPVLVEAHRGDNQVQVLTEGGDSFLMPLTGREGMKLRRPPASEPARAGLPEWGATPRAQMSGQPLEAASPAPFELAARAKPNPTPDISPALQDTDARVAGADLQRAEQDRRQTLDAVLARDNVRHPAMAFAAELRRQGVRDTAPTTDEQARIRRYQDAQTAFNQPEDNRAPSLPNEMDVAALVPEKKAAPTASPAAKPAQPLPEALRPLADKARTPQQFYQLAKKAGVPNVTAEDTRRQLIAAYKAYRQDPPPAQSATPDATVSSPEAAAPAASQPPTPQPAPARSPTGWHAQARQVDVRRDTVRDAIARMGGLRQDQALREWGPTLVEGQRSRVFGKPLFRRTGGQGLTLDHAREALAEHGYLPADSDINDLYEAFAADRSHPARLEAQAAAKAEQSGGPAATIDAGASDPLHPSLAHDPLLDGPSHAWMPDDELLAEEVDRHDDAGAEALQALVSALGQKLPGKHVADLLERLAIQHADQPYHVFLDKLEGALNGRTEDLDSRSTGQAAPAAGKPADQRGGLAAPDRAQQRPGREGEGGFQLDSYTEAELKDREAAAQEAASQRKKTQQQEDSKHQADAEAADFVLTGSDSHADQLAARGQSSLFDAPSAAAVDTTPSRSSSPTETDTPAAPPAPAAIRAKSGQPFKSLGVAKLQAQRHPGHEPVAVDGGYELRQQTKPAAQPAEAPPPAGEAIAEDVEFPTKAIGDSYRHISHSSRSAGEADKARYERVIQQIRDKAEPMIETPAQREAYDAALLKFKRDYIQQSLQLARAREGTVSGHVAGRSKFNSKQASWRGSAYDRAQEAFEGWLKRFGGDVEFAVMRARTMEQRRRDNASVEAEKEARRADARRRMLRAVTAILNVKPGDNVNGKIVLRINKDRAGYPSSFSYERWDGVQDTYQFLELFRDVTKADLHSLMDEARLQMPQAQPEQQAAPPAEPPAADKPAAPAKKKKPAAQPSAPAAVESEPEKTAPVAGRPLPSADWNDFAGWWNGVVDGQETTAAEILQAFDTLAAPEGLASTLKALKVATLQRLAGWSARPDDKKADLVRKVRENTLSRLLLDKEAPPLRYVFGEDLAKKVQEHEGKVRDLVASLTDEDVRVFAQRMAKEQAQETAQQEKDRQRLADPQTREDFRDLLRQKRAQEDVSYRDAYLSLTPAQRARYDELEAEHTRGAREARQRAARNAVAAAQQKTGAQVLETKHTQKGHDLFVVQLDERVDRDSYNTLNAAAKRMGGYYSKYRGGGAIPGFQFRDRASADAFAQLAQGDSQAAQEAVDARRDAFDDDKSQSAAERLRTMAARLDELADTSLARDRKANTARRARFAAAAEAQASAQKAEAATMRRLADGIDSGGVSFLNLVRQKVQLEALDKHLSVARWHALQAQHGAKWDQHRGDPITPEVADHAEWPSFTVWQHDLASLARQMLALDGGKQLGERLLKVANDVTAEYEAFARANLSKVATFSLSDGSPAVFANRHKAELAVARSGKRGQAIVLSVKRGENAVILSPQAAAEAGVWESPAKRVTLTPEFAGELIAKMRQHPNQLHQLNSLLTPAADRARLAGMGIATATELRAALREYIGLREAPAAPDKVKQLERAMVGRQNDGLDFFPTGPETVAQILDAAELEPGMRVLEPSAGMGHIAEQIRAAGAEPEVIELSPARRELLEAKGFNLVGDDFLAFNNANQAGRGFTYGDLMEAPDGTRGILRGQGGMGSDRVRLVSDAPAGEARELGKYNFSELTGVEHRGPGSGYDRIIMNPPFSDRRDAEHVRHAYTLLKPGGRLVAIMGEGVFFGQDKKAQAFREWLEQVGGTSEKLPDGAFKDPSLPVTTGASARMVVVDKVAELDLAGSSLSLGVSREDEGNRGTLARDAVSNSGRVDNDHFVQVERFVRDRLSQFREFPNHVVVDRFDALPAAVRKDLETQGGDAENTQGVYDHGTHSIYIVAGNHDSLAEVENTLYHELLGHYALDQLAGATPRERNRFKRRLYQHLGLKKVLEIAERHQLADAMQEYNRSLALSGAPLPVREIVMMDELYARLAEQGKPGARQRLLEVLGAFRQWLRDKGFAKLSQLGESDLALLLKQGRELIEQGQGKVAAPFLRYSGTLATPPENALSVDQARELLLTSPQGPLIEQLLDSKRIQLHQMVRTKNAPPGMQPALIQGVTTSDGTIHLVAGNLSADRLLPVLMHEMFHSGVAPLLGEARWKKLLQDLNSLHGQAQRSKGRAGELLRQAAARVDDARDSGAPMNAAEEFGAYAIELAEQAPKTWRDWADAVIGEVKAFLQRRFGLQLGKVTPEQLRALARAAVRASAAAQRQGTLSGGFGGMALAGAHSLITPEKTAISMREGNFPGTSSPQAQRDENIALGFEVQRKLKDHAPGWTQRIREIGLKGLRPMLSMLPGNAVVEMYRQAMPALFRAQRLGEHLDGRRQSMMEEADLVFRQWGGLESAAADKMSDLMHEATIWGIHPDQDAHERWRPEWKNKHAQLAKDWAALPAPAKTVYYAVRDLYTKRSEEMFQALADRIDRIENVPATVKQRMTLELRQAFDRNKGAGPYFPLARFGDYLVIASKTGGDDKTMDRIVLSAETEAEQKAMAEDLRARGFDNVKLDRSAYRKPGSDGGPQLTQFAASVMDRLEESSLDDHSRDVLLDEINQLLIEALPPASARKHYKHRKDVPGFSRDALRAFIRAQKSLASHVANLEYQDRIDASLRMARKQAVADQSKVNEYAQVVDEMQERAEIARTFKAHPIANLLSQLGFANFLGFSLSQGLLNLTQVPILTYPTLAARFNDAKASRALALAYKQVGEAMGRRGGESWMDVRKLKLSPDEENMLAVMKMRGKLDLTMAMDLVRGEGTSQEAGRSAVLRGAQWAGRYMGVFAHVTEAANRQVSALAAYRLAKEAGWNEAKSLNYAADVLDGTQFNYGFGNRPRILMSNTGRVLGMLHTFAIHTLFRVGRNLAQAMHGRTVEERQFARRFLVRMLAVQTGFAGLSSLPVLPVAGAVAGGAAYRASKSRTMAWAAAGGGIALMEALLGGLGHDDNEPWDWQAELRAFLADITGSKTAAELLDRGLIRGLGVDVANRISMGDLLFRDVDTGPRDSTTSNWLDKAFVQLVGGAAFGAVANYAKAADMANKGHYDRAMEAALPKFAGDLLKAGRYAKEDIRVVDGPATVKRADASAFDVVAQALGFTPSKVAEKNAEIRTMREAQSQMSGRRGELVKAWVASRINEDGGAEEEARKQIGDFNSKQPGLRISGNDLRRALISLKKDVSRQEGGVVGSKRYRALAGAVDQYNTEE
ncbi:PLxRFG domain-containing protein [Chromobacterium vaccinii]|uniref:PLxRFG domain-containing protein n=1 Tax=Chromobacterium vaccinii TaxID=1108595 RepID=UPI0031E2F310